MIEFDTSQLRLLANDLGKSTGRTVSAVVGVVRKGAHNVYEEMRSDAESDGHYKHFSRSISWSETSKIGEVSAEIGPDPSRIQGPLDNLLYFGSSKSAPVLDIDKPLKSEEPRFIAALAAAAGKAVL